MGSLSPAEKPGQNRVQELEKQVQELQSRLDEAQEVLRAIHSGEVDAVLVSTPDGDRTFTLEGADHPYRVFIENIGEGAVTVTPEGTILYCNSRFAQIAQQPQERIVGTSFFNHLPLEHHALVTVLLKQSSIKECKGEIELTTSEGFAVPLQLSVTNLRLKDAELRCVVVTDLTEHKRNQEILAQERLTRLIFEQVSEAIILCDEKGIIIRANRKAMSWGGGSDILFKRFDEAFDLCSAGEDALPFLISDILEGKKISHAELRLSQCGLPPLCVIGNVLPLYNAGRTVVGSLVTLFDITESKKAGEALQRSEKKYRDLLETANSIILRWAPDGTLRYVNDYGLKFFGYSREELQGASVQSLIPERDSLTGADLTRLVENIARDIANFQYSENENITKQGERRWVMWTNKAILDEHGNIREILAIGNDITDLKRSKAKLEELKEYYRTLSENLPEVISRVDRSLKYTYMSPSAYRLGGKLPEYYIGKTLEETTGSLDGKALPAVREVFASGRQKEVETQYDTSSGRRHFQIVLVPEFDEKGSVETVLAITRDVTQLKRSEEKFAHIVSSISDGFFAVDKYWRFTYINRRAASNMGFEPEQLIGESLWERFPGITGSPHETNYRTVMDRRQPALFEVPGVLTGSWYSISVYPSVDGGISVFWTDISERKRAEEVLRRDKESLEQIVNVRTRELLQAHAELMRAKRMSDVGRLAATVAHEIRNPLSAIRTAAYNIRRKSKDQLLDKHLETINKKVLESDHIIQNLLSFTRVRSASYETFKIGEALTDSIATVATKYAPWNAELKVNLKCAEDDVIEADLSQFKMLLSNVLDNAYQALHDKAGTISVTLRKTTNRTWALSIADTGVGMNAEELEQIFEPFYTTKSRGTGLGLAVCREIVEMHGGKIEVESAKGKGTVFTITLPARRASARTAHAAGRPADRSIPRSGGNCPQDV